jgi:lipoprotein-releasing system ATP-binding protein
MSGVLYCENIDKSYQQGPQRLQILRQLNFHVAAGQHLAIVGASGSGKSTLLNVLGGLDKPDTGKVYLQGREFSTLSENARGRMRNQHLGFVYQFHHLLAEFSALENVAMPLLIARKNQSEAFDRARDLLGRVGLTARELHKPAQLSGGERQRVAIARALANQPACVLMDEPTGNLDGKNARAVQTLMQELSAQLDTAFVVVTHDLQFARTLDSILELRDGALAPVDPE